MNANIGSKWNRTGFEGSLDFYRKETGESIMTIGPDRVYFGQQNYFKQYYVDGNTTNTVQDGLSWETAFDTLAEALAASHASIALAANRAWAKRNVIWTVGDSLTEDLTKLADKTDVIGLGTCDGFGPGARILGNHVIEAAAYIGCRFINVAFKDNDATGTIFTAVTQNGALQFIGCDFLTGTATVTGLLATAVTDLQVKGCRFLGSWASSFSTAAISLGAGTGHRTIIDGCQISNTHVSGVAILVNASRAGSDSYISNCLIDAKAVTIDDNSDTFFIVNNRIFSAANLGATSHDWNDKKACGNYISTDDHLNNLIPAAT